MLVLKGAENKTSIYPPYHLLV